MRALRGALGVERQKSRVGVGARAGRTRPGGRPTRAVGRLLDGVGGQVRLEF